jgi:hypothetical protein
MNALLCPPFDEEHDPPVRRPGGTEALPGCGIDGMHMGTVSIYDLDHRRGSGHETIGSWLPSGDYDGSPNP